MAKAVRRKSPRAPSVPLSDAIDGALRIYAKDARNPVSFDLAAQHLGYKNGKNGTAIKVLASLRYFGLLERPHKGKLAVEKEVERYRFTPDSEQKDQLVRGWLLTPPTFADVLKKFPAELPSDSTLKLELLQRGFRPGTADALVEVLRKSTEFARYYDKPGSSESGPHVWHPTDSDRTPLISPHSIATDRIPVRLSGGRRAYLEIPMPFYESDKERLKSQIDLLLVDEDGGVQEV